MKTILCCILLCAVPGLSQSLNATNRTALLKAKQAARFHLPAYTNTAPVVSTAKVTAKVSPAQRAIRDRKMSKPT